MNKLSILLVCCLSYFSFSCHREKTATMPSCCTKEHMAAGSAVGALSNGNSSVYQLPGKWTDQHYRQLSLNELKGKVQVIAMIFTHCTYACPRIVQHMKDIADSVSVAEKQEVGHVLVTFDTERDDPAQLARYADQQGLDGQWELLHGDADQIRELSMLLNVRYQQLQDRNFSHSNVIVILDKEGRIEKNIIL